MVITEVRIKLMDDNNERLQAFCSVTFDDAFVVRSLHADAQSGNLVHRGEAVQTTGLKEWFAANLPPVLEDFLEELKPKAAKDHFVSDLLDFLEVHSIVKLEEAAQAIRVPPEQLADYARHHPVQLGYLAGPPAVLFRAVPGRAGDPCEAD